MSALAFYLDAPMQAWGASSKYQYRETAAFPTKSGLTGLIAAALGIDKHELTEAADLSPILDLSLTVVRLPKQAQGKPLHSTRLTDFHTVGGGYDKAASLREKLSIPKKASGAPFGTVITRRTYLTDTSFAAVLEGEETVLARISSALTDPVWGIWLGRKTCLPSTPLTPTLGQDREEAFTKLLAILPQHEAKPLAEFDYQEEITEGIDPGQGHFFQSDQPVAFGQHQVPIPTPYRARAIRQHRP